MRRPAKPLIRLALPIAKLIGKAPSVTVFSAGELEEAMKRAGFEVMSLERHGSTEKDFRLFIMARRV